MSDDSTPGQYVQTDGPGPEAVVTDEETVRLDDEALLAVKKPGPMTLEDRQGVWVHSFKCSICDLEFALFSWLPNRHGVGHTSCPECGQKTPMLHWRAQTSASPAFGGDGTEIYQMSPLIDGPMLDDSIPPDEDRYDIKT